MNVDGVIITFLSLSLPFNVRPFKKDLIIGWVGHGKGRKEPALKLDHRLLIEIAHVYVYDMYVICSICYMRDQLHYIAYILMMHLNAPSILSSLFKWLYLLLTRRRRRKKMSLKKLNC